MRGRRISLFTLTVRRPGLSPESIPIERFPFVIGRAASASHRIEAPGVFDQHLIFELDPVRGLEAQAGPGAVVTVGGVPFERHWVRQGDEFMVGQAQVEVLLSPARRKSLALWEVCLWTLFTAVTVTQLVLIWKVLEH